VRRVRGLAGVAPVDAVVAGAADGDEGQNS
jgi:hypothetical protein